MNHNRPVLWHGKLSHARTACDDWGYNDWGWIKDQSGALILEVKLPTYNEAVLQEHRNNKTDPAQDRVDRLLACIEACEGMEDPVQEIHTLREQLAQANAIINQYGGWQQRTPREVEIAEALAETSEANRDYSDHAIQELLTLIEALRGQCWKTSEDIRTLQAKYDADLQMMNDH